MTRTVVYRSNTDITVSPIADKIIRTRTYYSPSRILTFISINVGIVKTPRISIISIFASSAFASDSLSST